MQNIIDHGAEFRQSSTDIMGNLNTVGQRMGQAIDKMGAFHADIDGDTNNVLDFNAAVSKWQGTYNSLYRAKVRNVNNDIMQNHINDLRNQLHKAPEENTLFRNFQTILYADTDLSFQDSGAVSQLSSIRTTSTYDNKQMHVAYSSIKQEAIDYIMGSSDLNAEFYERLSHFDKSNITNSTSFEHKTLKALLGDDNFQKYIDARYSVDANGVYHEIELQKVFEQQVGSTFQNFSTKSDALTEKDFKKLGEAANDTTIKFNNFLDKFLIKSNDSGKTVDVLNKGFFNNGTVTGISGSNYGFIANISFDKDGINIDTKGTVTMADGAKMMMDIVKKTIQRTASAYALKYGNKYLTVEGFVDEKMTKGKRGFFGTFLGRSMMTMAVNGVIRGDGADSQERFNNFIDIMNKEAIIKVGKKSSPHLKGALIYSTIF